MTGSSFSSLEYNYQRERAGVFTEEGSRCLLLIFEQTKILFYSVGCCTVSHAIKQCSGSTWLMRACVDYLVETGKMFKLENRHSAHWMHDVLVPVKDSAR